MVYGTTLRIPGVFFNPQANDNFDPIDYVQNLKKLMQKLQAVPPCSIQHQSVHIPSDLFTQSHIFVHHDAVQKLLQAPYDGPYRIISRMKKLFTIDINGQHEVVSLDCLKAAAYWDTKFSLLDTMSTHSLPHTGTSNLVTTTCLGRKVRWPLTF